ncbi:MAG: hypothetical protein O9341_18055 [Paucibacter sp.]|nr:hypothetical protein [Roseateles sp.]
MKHHHHRPAQPPRHVRRHRAFRHRLQPQLLVQLSTCLHVNLDAIATGQADVQLLWDYVSTTLTFSHIAEALGEGEPEMAAQLELGLSLVNAFVRTGRVLFTGPEYQLAKLGVLQMEALTERCSLPIAVAAATRSEEQLLALKAANPTIEEAAPCLQP